MIDVAAPREVKEWIGKTPDQAVPDRVVLRVFFRCKGRCQHCGRKLTSQDKPQTDHIHAIINGGENRETNLDLVCSWCHSKKTKKDVAMKAKTYKSRKRNLGMHKTKGRPMPGTKASGWRHRMDGTWERRS